MKVSMAIATMATLLLANVKVAHAGFIGTFTPVPEPSTLSLLAVGAGGVAVVSYLRSRNRDD